MLVHSRPHKLGIQIVATAVLRRVLQPCYVPAVRSAEKNVNDIMPECQNEQNPIFMMTTTSHKSASNRVRERTSAWFMHAVIVGLLSIAGCLNPQFTRFPSCSKQFPAAENAAYSRQDPFPDPDIGPSTDSSPRGYERPRSTARQAAEQRLLQGVPVGPSSVAPGVPQGSRNNDQAVY
ncbi:MAG: hypothetical protein DWI22_04620 [Planctomycetota bacterium]|nr:MAG: hypothetical protein DWI22_04620 [Planctomycetota bacterium]